MPSGETTGDVAVAQITETPKPSLDDRLRAIAAEKKPNAKQDLIARLQDNKNRTGVLAEDTVALVIGNHPDLPNITNQTFERLGKLTIDYTGQDTRVLELVQEILTDQGLVSPQPKDFKMKAVEELQNPAAFVNKTSEVHTLSEDERMLDAFVATAVDDEPSIQASTTPAPTKFVRPRLIGKPLPVAPETPPPTPTVAEQIAQTVNDLSHDEVMSVVHGTHGQEAPAPDASPSAELPVESSPPPIPVTEKPSAPLPTPPTEPITRGMTPEDQYKEIQKEKQQVSDPFAKILEGPRSFVQQGQLTSASAAYLLALGENPGAGQAIIKEMEDLYLNNKTNSTIRTDFANALFKINQAEKSRAVLDGRYIPENSEQQKAVA